jgi:alkylated DNA repair dioxygenase AlkB
MFALNLPDGFTYDKSFVTSGEEEVLVQHLEREPFKEFEFQGFTGKRRVVSYGWRYDFNQGGLQRATPMPAYLENLRRRAEAFAQLTDDSLEHVLLTEYQPGAPIGWHKDRSVFDTIVGISLLSESSFRLRRKTGNTWERVTITLAPRSAYVLRGAVRTEWEHSIPPVEALRYSITFRSLRTQMD